MIEAVNNNQFVQTCKDVFQNVKDKAVLAGRSVSNFVEANPKTVNVAKKVTIFALGLISVVSDPITTAIGFTAGLFFSKHVQSGVDSTKNLFKRQNPFIKGLMIVGAAIVPFIPVVSGLTLGALAGSETRKMMK